MVDVSRAFRFPVLLGVILALGLAALAWLVVDRLTTATQGESRSREASAVPVEVADIERGRLEERRTFSGTLSPRAQAAVAPKIAGRIERMTVELGDSVRRGEMIAELDDAEAQQAVAQAEAELAVAEANRAEAESALSTALREYERVQTLSARGVASESQLDVAEANRLAREAELKVAQAEIRRYDAALAAARIRLGYTQVRATWADGDEERVVAERFVDAGDTVGASTPLVQVVSVDPLDAVVFVTERDYGRLQLGQAAEVMTDAYPTESFPASVVRVSPVFRQASRQARVELEVPNLEHKLKPGMFARVNIALSALEDAIIVPVAALVTRDGQTGVFVINEQDQTALFRPVEVGIGTPRRVAVTGDGLEGRVVTLGQQLLEHGTQVTIPADRAAATTQPQTEASAR